ncbi:hypothetical protein pb186bvf_011810 [Paramecium bursaria]
MVKVFYNVEGVNPMIKFHLFDPINLPIINEEGKSNQITFEVLDSGEHRMCFNNYQSQSLDIDFDIEILGKEKFFLNKEKLGENVQYLNMIEMDQDAYIGTILEGGNNIRLNKQFVQENKQFNRNKATYIPYYTYWIILYGCQILQIIFQI